MKYQEYVDLYKQESGLYNIQVYEQNNLVWVELSKPTGNDDGSEYALETYVAQPKHLSFSLFRNSYGLVERRLTEEIHKAKSRAGRERSKA